MMTLSWLSAPSHLCKGESQNRTKKKLSGKPEQFFLLFLAAVIVFFHFLTSFSHNPCMAQGTLHYMLGTPFTSFIIIFHDIHFTPPRWWTPLNFCRNCCILQAVLFFQLAQAGYIFLLLCANFFTDYIYLFTLPYHAAAPLWYIRAFCPC